MPVARPALRHEVDLIGHAAPDGISMVVRGEILIDTGDSVLNEEIRVRYQVLEANMIMPLLKNNWEAV